MKSVLLDTHTWAWSLTGDIRLSKKANDSISNANRVWVSPISLMK